MVNIQNEKTNACSGGLSSGALEVAAQCLKLSAGELQVSRLTGDASSRSYFRTSAGGRSVIASLYSSPFDEHESAAARLDRLAAAEPNARLTFANDPSAHVEVTRLFLEAGVPVPGVLGVSGLERVIIFEDVGDLRLQDWLRGRASNEVFSMYRRAVDLIVAIQEATSRAIESNSICRHLAFDDAKLGWEMDFFVNNYFGRYVETPPHQSKIDAAKQDLVSLCSEIAALPRVLTHRDYHARNLMMIGSDVFIIDHQDARMGPNSYDLASLLNDPYVTIDYSVKSELLGYFIKVKSSRGQVFMPSEEFRRQFNLVTVQRTLKAVGTYSYQSAVAKNSVYEPYIGPALETALSSLDRLGRFESLAGLIRNALS